MQSKLVELLPESTGHNLIHRQDASDETRQFGSLIYMIFGQTGRAELRKLNLLYTRQAGPSLIPFNR